MLPTFLIPAEESWQPEARLFFGTLFVKFNVALYTVVGPNNESKITKKIRYFTPFPENNEITKSEKIVICLKISMKFKV